MSEPNCKCGAVPDGQYGLLGHSCEFRNLMPVAPPDLRAALLDARLRFANLADALHDAYPDRPPSRNSFYRTVTRDQMNQWRKDAEQGRDEIDRALAAK